VILYGSWARNEASWQDSDVDLLVALDRVDDPRAEDKRIDPVAGDLFLEAGRPVIVFAVGEGEFSPPVTPFLEAVLREGIDFLPVRA
jgi:predicted nucleotidyltransferase